MSNHLDSYFYNKVVIITGAGSGIGQELGRRMLDHGAIVTFADINSKSLLDTKRSLKNTDKAHFYPVDVSRNEQVKLMVESTAKEFGRLDILINNAGIMEYGPVENFTPENWKRIFDINFWGVLHGTYAALPIMIKQGSGQIANTASLAGILTRPFEATYTSSKFAVLGFTDALYYEMQHYNIDVSTITPCDIFTSLIPNSQKIAQGDKSYFVNELGENPNMVASVQTQQLSREELSPAAIVGEILEGLAYKEQHILVPRDYIVKNCQLNKLAPFYCNSSNTQEVLEVCERRRHLWETKGVIWE